VKPGKPFPIDVPHPLKTFTDPIALKNQAAAAKIPGDLHPHRREGHETRR